MQTTLQNNNFLRPTALKNLQIQEDGDPFKILIGTILSARTRDEITTKVIADLFSEFKNAEMLSKANLKKLKKVIQKIHRQQLILLAIEDLTEHRRSEANAAG